VRRILVCGFGNPSYHRDASIERAVVNEVRKQLEQALLDSSSDGFNVLEQPIDTVVLHQLVPEIAERVVDYDLVIFVHADVAAPSELPREECLVPAYRSAAFVSHQTRPATVLELARRAYGYAPQAVMLSLHDHDFDSDEGLSLETANMVSLAVERILDWAQANPVNRKHNHLFPVQKDRPSTRCQSLPPKVY
jgi:Ni,Fe-hydrogenase maturation factor